MSEFRIYSSPEEAPYTVLTKEDYAKLEVALASYEHLLEQAEKALEEYLASEPLNHKPEYFIRDAQIHAVGQAQITLTALRERHK